MNEIYISNSCKVCCECINVCRNEVLGIRSGKVFPVRLEECAYCEDCTEVCPEGAIHLMEKKI